jgi:predicted alpha/beta superfamily hydrolase
MGEQETPHLRANLASFPVHDWDDELTPWLAPGLYHGDADFEGLASRTYERVMGPFLDGVEAAHGLQPRSVALAGFSLAGLFSLHSFMTDTRLAAAASLSGSVWYEGWPDYLAGCTTPMAGRFAYLSIGTKERLASPEILHAVEDRTRLTAETLRRLGAEVEFRTGPGSHLQHVDERITAGLEALDAFLAG